MPGRQKTAGCYEKAFAIDPAEPVAAIGEARALSVVGGALGAAKPLARVVASDPKNTTLHFRLSAVYRKLGAGGVRQSRNYLRTRGTGRWKSRCG